MAKAQRPSELKMMAALRLRAARMALGIERQEALANKLKVTASAYNNWETGARMPDIAAMVRLWEATGIGPDWIYAGSLNGVPYSMAERLKECSAEVGAVVGGAVAEWPMAAERAALPKPAAAVPARRPRHITLHEPPPLGPEPPRKV
jgi:transcriptional regulator with XRE-family HTH domain